MYDLKKLDMVEAEEKGAIQQTWIDMEKKHNDRNLGKEERKFKMTDEKKLNLIRLQDLNLYESVLENISFEDCNFEDIDFSCSTIKCKFRNCFFRNVDFGQCMLSQSHFVSCIFENCNFEKATMRVGSFAHSKLVDCNLIDFLMDNVDLLAATFYHCNASSTPFSFCCLDYILAVNTNFTAAHFTSLSMKSCDLHNCDFQNAIFSSADIFPITMKNCNLDHTKRFGCVMGERFSSQPYEE